MTKSLDGMKTPAAKTTTKTIKTSKTGNMLDILIAFISLLVFAAGTFRDIQLELRGNPIIGIAVSVLVVFYGTAAVAKVIVSRVK